MQTGMNHCDCEAETVFRFDPVGKRWHGWTRNARLARKLIGNQWEIIGVDDKGTSFIAPRHALQIFPTDGKKCTAREKAERMENLCRAQISYTVMKRGKANHGR